MSKYSRLCNETASASSYDVSSAPSAQTAVASAVHTDGDTHSESKELTEDDACTAETNGSIRIVHAALRVGGMRSRRFTHHRRHTLSGNVDASVARTDKDAKPGTAAAAASVLTDCLPGTTRTSSTTTKTALSNCTAVTTDDGVAEHSSTSSADATAHANLTAVVSADLVSTDAPIPNEERTNAYSSEGMLCTAGTKRATSSSRPVLADSSASSETLQETQKGHENAHNASSSSSLSNSREEDDEDDDVIDLNDDCEADDEASDEYLPTGVRKDADTRNRTHITPHADSSVPYESIAQSTSSSSADRKHYHTAASAPPPSRDSSSAVASSSCSTVPRLYSCDVCSQGVLFTSMQELTAHALCEHKDQIPEYAALRAVTAQLVPLWSAVRHRKQEQIVSCGAHVFRVAQHRDAGPVKMAEAHCAREQLEVVVQRWRPSVRVYIFGSSVAFGVWDGVSDIDFTVVDVEAQELGSWPPPERNAVRSITELLRRAGFAYANIDPISHARVPIIKHHASRPIRCTKRQSQPTRLGCASSRSIVTGGGGSARDSGRGTKVSSGEDGLDNNAATTNDSNSTVDSVGRSGSDNVNEINSKVHSSSCDMCRSFSSHGSEEKNSAPTSSDPTSIGTALQSAATNHKTEESSSSSSCNNSNHDGAAQVRQVTPDSLRRTGSTEAEEVIRRSVRYLLSEPVSAQDRVLLETCVRDAVGAGAVQQVWWNRTRDVMSLTCATTTHAMIAATCPLRLSSPQVRLRVEPLHEECRPELYHVDFDLSFRVFGIRNSLLLQRYLMSHPCARPGALVLKDWSKTSGVNNSVNGYLTSYAINIMWIYFLVQKGVVPYVDPLDDIPGSLKENDAYSPTYCPMVNSDWTREQQEALYAQAGELLLGFFYFYANEFDWDNHVVSLNRPGITTKAMLDWDVEDIASALAHGCSDGGSNYAAHPHPHRGGWQQHRLRNGGRPSMHSSANLVGSNVHGHFSHTSHPTSHVFGRAASGGSGESHSFGGVGGGSGSSSAGERRRHNITRYTLCIEDPYEDNLNLGRHMGITKALRVQTELCRALLSLLKDSLRECCVFRATYNEVTRSLNEKTEYATMQQQQGQQAKDSAQLKSNSSSSTTSSDALAQLDAHSGADGVPSHEASSVFATSSAARILEASKALHRPEQLPLRVVWTLMSICTEQMAQARRAHVARSHSGSGQCGTKTLGTDNNKEAEYASVRCDESVASSDRTVEDAEELPLGIEETVLHRALSTQAPLEFRLACKVWNWQQLVHRLGYVVHRGRVRWRREIGDEAQSGEETVSSLRQPAGVWMSMAGSHVATQSHAAHESNRKAVACGDARAAMALSTCHTTHALDSNTRLDGGDRACRNDRSNHSGTDTNAENATSSCLDGDISTDSHSSATQVDSSTAHKKESALPLNSDEQFPYGLAADVMQAVQGNGFMALTPEWVAWSRPWASLFMDKSNNNNNNIKDKNNANDNYKQSHTSNNRATTCSSNYSWMYVPHRSDTSSNAGSAQEKEGVHGVGRTQAVAPLSVDVSSTSLSSTAAVSAPGWMKTTPRCASRWCRLPCATETSTVMRYVLRGRFR